MSPRPGKGHVPQDRWMVSYADFITLLFAFFVVLYAFAKSDQQKQQQVTASIDSAFRSMGFLPESTRSAGGANQKNAVMEEDLLYPAKVKEDLTNIQHVLELKLAKQIASHAVDIQMGRDGLVISLREAGFFNSGSATPMPEAMPTLRQIAASLGPTPYDMRIEGHTDNVPIHTAAFDSNWELSSARATHIARIFLDLKAIAPERLSAAGYAEFHPVASNDTAEGRNKNRRVDLVVLPRTKLNLAASRPANPTGAWRKITDGDAPAQAATPAPTPPPAP